MQQRLLERLVYNFAQIIQMTAQGVRIGQQIAPDFALDRAPANDARRLEHQDRQQAQADRRNQQFLAGARQAQAGGIEHQVADAEQFGADLAALTPDQSAHARFELADLERLDQIVVGASVESDELVLERVARGQHQHRRRFLAVDAQLAADIQAIHARQHEVEHDDIVAVGHGQMQSGHAVRGVIDAVAAAFEELADHFGNPAVVLDQKDQTGLLVTLFHGLPFPATTAGAVFTFVKDACRGVTSV